MTTGKPARKLSAVPSTLRIPLAARASGDALFPQMAVRDAYAAGILEKIRDDDHALPDDRTSIYGILARTRRFRSLAQDFLKLHPGARVVNMGCGLSHYFQWLDDGKSRMTDADLPEVLDLRRELLPETHPRHDLRELDLTAPDWWDQLGLPRKRQAQPVFLFTEGVLMYLEPEQVNAVFATFGERAPPGSVLAFDAMCWLAVGRARQHPSVRATGAEFRWGLRRSEDLTRPHPHLQLEGTYRVMEGMGWPYTLFAPMVLFFLGVPIYAVYALKAKA
ncbi:class I SAM-dependent methyltransferase [Acidovorax cavernicola]|uniref:class I SAM-dependent methyltransferase n=1 Tax=Acidovorax cavernicola TaxID=1675792 RepID=UPI00197AC541|nr:class I SAM-dependent methyltransferase [Acidovorax cavernicola]